MWDVRSHIPSPASHIQTSVELEVPLAHTRRFAPVVLGACIAALAACSDPAPTTGAIQFNVTGIPAGGEAKIAVANSEGFSQTVTTSTTLEGLAPGKYFTRVDTVIVANNRYGTAVIRDTFEVAAGRTEAATVAYALASGSINFTVNGLPAGTNADIKLVAPGFIATVTAAGVVGGVPPGKVYIFTDSFTTTQGDRIGAAKYKDSVTVAASLTPVPATVNYAVLSGTLALTVNGMPSSLPESQLPVTITGPGGFQLKTSGSSTVRGLNPGTYTVNAAKASGTCPTVYKTTSSTQSIGISAAQTGSITVNYTEGPANPAELNLKIEKVELIQVTQDEVGSVPMVANRKALVRVYGVADQCNSATPKVRLTLSTAAGPITLNAPESSVRFKTDISTLVSTWNYTTTASEIAAPLTVVAEIDPDNAFVEANDADNRYPASGSLAVTVRTVPVIGIRLVPVNNGGLTGSVDADALMRLARKIHPVPGYDVSVRSPFTTTRSGALNAGGGAWPQVLDEIDALRFADNSNRYYYGVVKVNYDGGVAGIAFVNNCVAPDDVTRVDCRAAIGWDHLQTSADVFAHEVGHNFGRFHAPSSVCGESPAQVDFTYPNTGLYQGGRIGQYGYDVETGALKPPEQFNDVMGYCTNLWISDHMYRGMLSYLSDPNRMPTLPSLAGSESQPSLYVWGRIIGGVAVLEPALELTARPKLPPAGPHRLTVLDERGAEILSINFAARAYADLPGGGESFGFAIPISMLRGRTAAQLRLEARGRTVTSVRSAELGEDPAIKVSRTGPGRVRLQWDAVRFPMAMVRDRQTGEVLSFARGGDATIVAAHDDLEVSFSNRVRSMKRSVPVPK